MLPSRIMIDSKAHKDAMRFLSISQQLRTEARSIFYCESVFCAFIKLERSRIHVEKWVDVLEPEDASNIRDCLLRVSLKQLCALVGRPSGEGIVGRTYWEGIFKTTRVTFVSDTRCYFLTAKSEGAKDFLRIIRQIEECLSKCENEESPNQFYSRLAGVVDKVGRGNGKSFDINGLVCNIVEDLKLVEDLELVEDLGLLWAY